MEDYTCTVDFLITFAIIILYCIMLLLSLCPFFVSFFFVFRSYSDFSWIHGFSCCCLCCCCFSSICFFNGFSITFFTTSLFSNISLSSSASSSSSLFLHFLLFSSPYVSFILFYDSFYVRISSCAKTRYRANH